MAAAHACGLFVAVVAHRRSSTASECSWYLFTYTFDTAVGTLLTIGLHKLALEWARRRSAALSSKVGCDEPWHAAVAACGSYGSPPQLRRFGIQAAEWVCCVVLARAACGILVSALRALPTTGRANSFPLKCVYRFFLL
jgi:hypothetical protein